VNQDNNVEETAEVEVEEGHAVIQGVALVAVLKAVSADRMYYI
jgi:hypothetical protein